MASRITPVVFLIAAACASGNQARMAAAPMDTAAAPARAKPQMQAVLDQLAALEPKPITELSAPAARQQASPADAVKALLAKQGKSTAPMPVGNVVNQSIPGPGGGRRRSEEGFWPVVVILTLMTV